MRLLVFFILFSLNASAQVNLNQGLLLYLPFNGNMLDASGNGVTVTNVGATLAPDQNGNPNSACYLNGNARLQINSQQVPMGSSVSLCVKLKPMSFYNGLCYNNNIIDCGNGGYNSGSYSLIYSPTLNQNPANYCVTPDTNFENYRININTSAFNSLNTITPINAVPYIQSNQWDCVIGIFDATTSTASIYVDGQFRYSFSFPAGMGAANASTLFIGGTNNPTYPYNVHGIVDEIRIYNRPLNLQEIDSLCNSCSMTLTAPAVPPLCSGQTTALSVSGGTTYTWVPNAGLSNPNIANPLANPNITTTYTITGSSAAGCSATTTLTVVVNPSPALVVLPANPSICFGQSAPLVASGAMSYSWLPITGLSNATIANPIANPNVTTTYTITGSMGNGCTATTTVTVNVGSTLNITANPSNPNLCMGQSIPLSCSGSATNYSWQPTGTLSNPSIPNPVAFPTTNTTYTVTASNAQGCTGTATVSVNVWPLPNINVSPSVNTICMGDSVLLQLSGGLNYTWMPNQYVAMQGNNAAYVFPYQNTIYTITGYDIHDCSNTASAVVNVNPKPDMIITGVGMGICVGDSATLTAMGGINYTWEPAATVYPSTGNPVTVFPTQTTTYTATGTDANGCTNTATYDVDVTSVLDFKVVKNRDIECGFNQAQLFASGADTYSWWPSTGLNNANSATPIVQIDETTTYYVTGVKGNCLFTDSITVYVFKNNEASVFVPNAFSPNGDGVNDCIRPMHQANFKRYYFTVYNRFGNKVFSTYDPNECWNGQYKYKDAEVGIYFYYLTGETNCGEIIKKGDIMLMR